MPPSIDHVVNRDALNCCYVKKNKQKNPKTKQILSDVCGLDKVMAIYKLSLLFSCSLMINTHLERLSRR